MEEPRGPRPSVRPASPGGSVPRHQVRGRSGVWDFRESRWDKVVQRVDRCRCWQEGCLKQGSPAWSAGLGPRCGSGGASRRHHHDVARHDLRGRLPRHAFRRGRRTREVIWRLRLPPDPTAEAITAKALLDTLGLAAPELVSEARALRPGRWIDLATGRAKATGPLAEVMPVMA